ncbi:hypothetical protein [Desulfoscipio geothermicus]|uniref:hypothetical protein n=1 Tax=Desulfoscipio geothermicus TaxID=39060 RepID=UPI0013F4CBB5|nr:hypothetical protein [Desulfoscipio geothermicus]
MDFSQALLYLLDLFKQTLRENLFLSDAMIDQILTRFLEKLPSFIKLRLCFQAA